MNIGIIGLGKLDKPTSEVLIEEGHNVKGYDINGDGVSSIKECVSNTDIVFVAVPTPHDPQYDGKHPCSHLEPKDFDYTIVKEVINEANKYMNKTQILVLISTVLPGTIRKHLLPVAKKTNLVYNPYLIAMGSVKWDIRNPEMIMIGGKTRYCNILENFYRDLCNCDRYIIGTYEECESIKIFYNTFISTKLAIVNMIQDVAVKLGNMNVDVVTDALANTIVSEIDNGEIPIDKLAAKSIIIAGETKELGTTITADTIVDGISANKISGNQINDGTIDSITIIP